MKQKIKERPRPERWNPDPHSGLTREQVRRRVSDGWTNAPAMPKSKSVGGIICENVFTFFNLIFSLLALCVIAVGSWHNLLFMIVVLLNTLIGIVQQIRAKITLDRLTLLCAPSAVAVRDGKEETVPSGELVLDDIVVFSAGAQICADAILCEGAVEVNESLLTGESDAVRKGRGDTLLSGSFIISGVCRARLDKVGKDSYAAKITSEARRHKKARSEMMSSLDRLIRVIGVIIVPFGLILFFKQLAMPGAGLRYAVESTVASAVGMIPEGLYLLTSVALAVSVVNLARSKTLVHELYCIETLARVDVLCLDKTGTITEGDMEVLEAEDLPGVPDGTAAQILAAYCRASSDGNATAHAIRARFAAPEKGGWTALREIPFSSARKWGCVDFGDYGVYALGAPEFVARACYEPLREKVEAVSRAGRRVLLLARCGGVPEGDVMDAPVEPLALVVLSDRIRSEVPKTFAFFKEQGVEIKVISGDNPAAVSEVARRAGVEGAQRYVDAQTLVTPADFSHAAQAYNVFGRVTPDQKRSLIAALKQAGHTVAMTGDGVNDVLALKDADCSIAMASGSEAAANVAQLVLLDSNFASMPKIVKEGRRVINNIERSASLFLVKNIFSFLITFLLLFLPMPYPFTPIQLTIVSSLTIGFPAFILALEPTCRRVQGRFMYNVLCRALPGGLTDAIVILSILAAGTWMELDLSVLSAACTLAAGFTGIVVLFRTCRPFDLIRRALWITVSVLFTGAIIVMWTLFVSVEMTLPAWLLTAAALAAVPPLICVMTRLTQWVWRAIEKGRPL